MPEEENLIRCFQPEDTEAVIALWKRCDLLRSWNDPHKDIKRKLNDSADLFFVMTGLLPDTESRASYPTPVVIGAAMAGYEGHRGWVNYLAIERVCRVGD